MTKTINQIEESSSKKSYFGFMKGTVKINDDIVNCSSVSDWEVNNESTISPLEPPLLQRSQHLIAYGAD